MSLDPNTTAPAPVPSWVNEAWAAARHVSNTGVTLLTVLGALAFLPPDTTHMAIEKLQMVGDDIHNLIGHLADLWVIVGPALLVMIGKIAASSAGLKAQLKSITRNPAVKIEGTIVAPPAVANAVPSDKVVPPS